MDEALRQQIIEFLKEELTLDVETTSNYAGGMDGGVDVRGKQNPQDFDRW